MEQLTLTNELISFPQNYNDLQSLYEKYIYEGEKDEDVFTWSEIKSGRSYYMYGKKVLEFITGEFHKAKIKIYPINQEEKPYTIKSSASSDDLLTTLTKLKEMKKKIFRNTIAEQFACCHDFKNCSAVGACIHQDDRFFNGCIYRSNLESGRNFYKE